MSTNEEIIRLAKALKTGLRSRVKVNIVLRNQTAKHIVKILESRNIIKTKVVHINRYEILVTASEVCLMNNQVVKAKNILNVARAILPSISGVLIISTPQGIMEHEIAHEKNLGVKMILGAY